MGGAKALSMDDFARLNNDDEASYVALLIESAAQLLKAQGHPDLADKAIALFKVPGKNGGVAQFASNLRMLHGLNTRNALNPNNRAPVYRVEDAMALTLKDDGIIVSAKDLVDAGNTFQPSGPPRPHGP